MIITPLCQRIFVRYARKPIWLPTAPSKLFRIAEHTFYSPEEVRKIRLLQQKYWIQERSLQEFMYDEFYVPATQTGGLPAEFIKREMDRDQAIYDENDKINSEIAKQKEEYLNNRMKELEARLLDEKMEREEKNIEKMQVVSEYIKQQKSVPDSFVTPENIERMIEKAFENQISYEYYIDPKGKKHGLGADR